jgi:uncharacterized phage-like protein YoqJ
MKPILIFLVVWTLESDSVFGFEKPNKFEKEINFLVNHMSGEVVVCRDQNSDLVNFFMERIKQQNQTGPIRLVDFDQKNQRKCHECKWIVMIQESTSKVINKRLKFK